MNVVLSSFKCTGSLQIRSAYTKYWTAGQLPQKRVCLLFDMDRETENYRSRKITQNSGISFVFHEQNFPGPRFVFCVNVSHVICKIRGNFRGEVGGEFTGNSRQILLATGSY